MGPDVLEVMRHLHRNVVVVPCGFTSDHLEILYDLDVLAAQLANELGVTFARTKSLNDDPRFLRVLADIVRRH
jgi:ferrochelatase